MKIWLAFQFPINVSVKNALGFPLILLYCPACLCLSRISHLSIFQIVFSFCSLFLTLKDCFLLLFIFVITLSFIQADLLQWEFPCVRFLHGRYYLYTSSVKMPLKTVHWSSTDFLIVCDPSPWLQGKYECAHNQLYCIRIPLPDAFVHNNHTTIPWLSGHLSKLDQHNWCHQSFFILSSLSGLGYLLFDRLGNV